MRAYRLVSLAAALVTVLALSACDVSTPSQVTTEQIRLKDKMVTEVLDARHVDAARINVIADEFMHKAKGGMTLTVSYLFGDFSAMDAAQKQADVFKKSFEKRGVPNVSVVIVPMAEQQYADKVVVTYKALLALPPKNCRRIPGYEGSETLAEVDEYQYGCEMKTAMSRMIADPSDLNGKAGSQDNDSRRDGATVETYRSGKPNDAMKGYQASKIGSGQ
jgi:type IV pilus biogenesis protein CpaD/CtpE